MRINSFSTFLVTSSFALFLSAFFSPGCSKTSPTYSPVTPNSTIPSIVKNSSKLTVYNKALLKTGLDTVFSGPGPFTVFAPSDAFFAAAGIDSNVINSMSVSDLRNIILYQAIAGEALLSANFPKTANASIIMANGDSVFVRADSTAVFVNGFQLRPLDVKASNGIIDGIEGVLIPAVGTLSQKIQNDTALSFLAAAVLRASQGSKNVDSLLKSSGPFTIFAPANNAFQASTGFSTISAINNTNPDTLARIITYHILSGRFFSSDLPQGQKLISLSGDSLGIVQGFGSGVRIKANSDSTAANISVANFLTRNGVLHKIDLLLLP